MPIAVAQSSALFDAAVAVHFLIVRAHAGSLVVWIGAAPADSPDTPGAAPTGHLAALAVAFPPTPNIPNPASSSLLPATSVDDVSEGIARRIAMKTKANVFVSCDLPPNATDLIVFAERKLVSLLKEMADSDAPSAK
ncbi:hypothetical protein HDU84_003266 [Entophlyctis sp. JEL0112]|nr:hypothetical protein HDU84_003266 [Entophlyctis sp. JEL0112]